MKEPRASPSVAAANGKIYVFGGDQIIEVNFYRARTTIAATECYDPLINTWTSSVELPQTRSESGAVVIWNVKKMRENQEEEVNLQNKRQETMEVFPCSMQETQREKVYTEKWKSYIK